MIDRRILVPGKIDPSNGHVFNKDDLEFICKVLMRDTKYDYKDLKAYVKSKLDSYSIRLKIRFSEKLVHHAYRAPLKRQALLDLYQLVEEISGALKSGDIMCEPLDEIINRIRGKMTESDSRSEKAFDPSLSDDVKQLRKVLSEFKFPDDAAGTGRPYWKGRLVRIHNELRVLSTVRLGEFRSSKAKKNTGTITLYTTAMVDFAKAQKIEFETVFFSTLFHEYFHALHYQLFKQQGIEDRWAEKWCDGERRIVQETLAAFYEWYSCRNNFLLTELPDADKLADHLKADWESLDIDLWPYSGALVLEDPDNNGLGKLFFRLLEMSSTNWSLAAKVIKGKYYLKDWER